MKRIYVLYFMSMMTPAVASVYTGNITDGCGSYGMLNALWTPNQYTCDSGEFLPANSTTCNACQSGYTCAGGTFTFSDKNAQGFVDNDNTVVQNETKMCAANFTHTLNAIWTPNQYTCNTGEFLPANSTTCSVCQSGYTCAGGTFTFNDKNAQGLVDNDNTVVQNEVKACAANFAHTLNAIWIPNQYTCNTGEFLPANSTTCSACQSGYDCAGGTFTFNETVDQYACAAGYYMPANTPGCVMCSMNSYCVGGTYYFDANVDQGVVSCASGLYAPTGMWEAAQCGRILHLGNEIMYLRSVKKTVPSLNIDIDNDGVADYFGNMTTTDVPMTRGTQRKLKLSYGGQTYSVYDDSVGVGE